MRGTKEIIYLLVITIVLTESTPEFGERLKKDDKNSSLIEVFRPNESKQLSKQSTSTIVKPIEKLTVQPIAQTIQIDSSNHNINANPESHPNHNYDNEFLSAQQDLVQQHRAMMEMNDVQPQSHQPAPHFPTFPDFSSLYNEFNKDFISNAPEVSSSDHIFGKPLPPPPPQAPQPPHQTIPVFHHPNHNYDSTGNTDRVYESAPNRELDPEFSSNVPKGYTLPKKDPSAGVEKQVMGQENINGKPWGTKTSYTYRDPKNPNNYMTVSEVKMSVNREMDPQEAQSQIQKFLTAAKSGQYGQFKPVRVQDDDQVQFDRHPNHNYGSEDDSFEPPEPNEQSFPDF